MGEGQNPVDQRYVGCWTADDPVQVLGNSPVKALEDPVRMNIASCVDACVRVGRRYAGLKVRRNKLAERISPKK